MKKLRIIFLLIAVTISIVYGGVVQKSDIEFLNSIEFYHSFRESPISFSRTPGDVDYIRYYIDIQIYPDSHFLAETTHVIFRSRISQLPEIEFLMYNDTLNIESVTCGNDTLSWAYDSLFWTLTVQLSDTLNVGEEDTLCIVYSGYITPELSQIFFHWCVIDSNICYCAGPSYLWYPTPIDWLSNMFNELASGEITLTVPNTFIAVSNGILIDSTSSATTRTFVWSTNRDILCFDFAAADYLVSTRPYQGIELSYYDFDTLSAGYILGSAESILNYYGQIFRPYNFEKLAFAEPLQTDGAYSSYTLVVMPSDISLTWLAHEVAHQWWGHAPHMEQKRDMWIVEGFAEYSSQLYLEDTLGTVAMRESLLVDGDYYLQIPIDEDRPIVPAPDTSTYYYEIVYFKGEWVLHMLRGVVGDSIFMQIMQTYAQVYHDSITDVDIFCTTAEQVSGQNLQWFFDEWLYDTGAPEYSYDWQTESLGVDSFNLTITVHQLDSLFVMPIQTTIFTPSYTQEEWIWVDDTVDTFAYIVNTTPDSVLLDRDNWLLDRGISYGIEEDDIQDNLPIALNLRIYPNPMRNHGNIEYNLSQNCTVQISIYDVTGRAVREVDNGYSSPGHHSRAINTESLSPGVYFIKLDTDNHSEIKKIILVH